MLLLSPDAATEFVLNNVKLTKILVRQNYYVYNFFNSPRLICAAAFTSSLVGLRIYDTVKNLFKGGLWPQAQKSYEGINVYNFQIFARFQCFYLHAITGGTINSMIYSMCALAYDTYIFDSNFWHLFPINKTMMIIARSSLGI